ncbi:hypothetical protein ACFOZY_03140 [Chungangia koreensis]|uniref:Uncharacterized protein n=1 Tax=Chungangia koreensis TaxID=752657 RepID=A0ABV8X2A3_9LACT
MSLVIGMAYRDEFVLVSNDSKVTYQYYEPETFEPIQDSIQETGLKHEKVFRLTNKVLISTTGYLLAGDLIKKEMAKRIYPESDLEDCANRLQILIYELKNGLVKGLTEEEQDIIRFIKGRAFTCNLFGFFQNGLTGMVDYNQLTWNVDIIAASLGEGYPLILQSPDPENDRANYYKVLSLAKEEQTVENFMSRLATVHAYLSSIHKGVSSDCSFHLLYRDGNEIRYITPTVETKDFYEQLGLTEDVK